MIREFKLSSQILTPMQTTQLIAKFLAAGVLSVAIAPLTALVAQADDDSRVAWLFDAQCVSESPGRWHQEVEDVSVGREVYRSVMFMGPGSQFASLACRIRGEDTDTSDKDIQSFQLEFGMRDRHRDSPFNNVIIYLDGEENVSTTVASGERVALSLDVSNISNIAIETVCSTKIQYCDRVYFFDASLSSDVALPMEESQNSEPSKFENVSPSEPPVESEPPESEMESTEDEIMNQNTLPYLN
jgi:hypothetical protein